jgi:hypothetical protein
MTGVSPLPFDQVLAANDSYYCMMIGTDHSGVLSHCQPVKNELRCPICVWEEASRIVVSLLGSPVRWACFRLSSLSHGIGPRSSSIPWTSHQV